jgi:hypothetical protein
MSAVAAAERTPAPLEPLDPFLQTISALASSMPVPPSGRDRKEPVWFLVAAAVVVSATALVRQSRERVDDAIAPASAPLARPAPAVAPSPPVVVAANPTRRIARLRVGQTLGLSLDASGDDLQYRWSVDDLPAGSGARWSYAPAPAEIGRRHVVGTVLGPGGLVDREWVVRVRAARPPRLVATAPGTPRVEVPAGHSVDFSVGAKASSAGERLVVTWTVDGRTTGTGPALSVATRKPGAMTVHVAVTSDLGSVTTHDWRIDVGQPEPPPEEPAPAAPVAAPASPSTPPPAAPAETHPGTPPPAHASTPRATPPAERPAEPAAQTSAADEQAKAFLDRYLAAWRGRDIDALRRLGQVTNDEQAESLRKYFASVQDLEIEVSLLGAQSEGGRTIIRFVRRDRFKNPLGRVVTKESPPIERALVTGPDGLRFAPGS